MNILFLTHKVPYPPKDGGTIATFQLIKGLHQQGNEVKVLSINTLKHHIDPTTNDVPYLEMRTVTVDTTIRPLDALRNLLFSKMPYNAKRFVNPLFSNALETWIKEQNFDIIQLEGLYLAPYIPLIRKYSKALIAMRAHNVEYEIFQRMEAQETKFLKKKYLQNLTERIRKFEISQMSQYDLLIPITERDATIFKSLGNTKPTHVSPTGIDMDTTDYQEISTTNPTLFFLGALDWTPNQEGLLWFVRYVWDSILKLFPTLELHIAGRNAPEWLIEKLKLKNIVYHGEVADAKDFMKSHTIMIAPLFSGSGMRIKIIEGMSLGKPIITTSIGSEGIASTTNTNILIANTVEEFIKHIQTAINDMNFCNEIGKKALTFVSQQYNNTNIAGSLSTFYKNQLKR